MALFVNGVGPDKIMILGRWKSDSWMKHIREQVEQWSSSMSVDMLRTEELFHVHHSQSNPPNHPALAQNAEFGGDALSPCGLIPLFNLNLNM